VVQPVRPIGLFPLFQILVHKNGGDSHQNKACDEEDRRTHADAPPRFSAAADAAVDDTEFFGHGTSFAPAREAPCTCKRRNVSAPARAGAKHRRIKRAAEAA